MEGRRKSLEGVRTSVQNIIDKVRTGGDAALREFASKYAETGTEEVWVTPEEIDGAYDLVDPQLVESLIEAEARITRYHELQRPRDLWLQEVEPGIVLGEKVTPLDRVGIYVPGRRAAYPSSVLMCAIPAQVAGVKDICCCSPPPIHPLTLVACDIVGVEEIYRAGGAQAIAAMALGTEMIRPVQKIVGPGNVYVTMAKMLLREQVEIDFPAGPSEIAILADASAHPSFIAADILAQAEHDPDAGCILVTTDAKLALKVGKEVERLTSIAERKDIITQALRNSGYLVVSDLDEGVQAIDRIAPEHLSIQVSDSLPVLNRVRHAGAIFIGPYTPVASGDYAGGTNHVLPTAGYATTYSGLDVAHFCKRISVEMLDREGLSTIAPVIEALATAEGLHAHADSVRIRLDTERNEDQ
ncbi:MAG: histidinol dehydrogenase [Methanomicrobiales archaeon]|nr:histidinol dehydrogenase [Methanomicrobiales archaeon]